MLFSHLIFLFCSFNLKQIIKTEAVLLNFSDLISESNKKFQDKQEHKTVKDDYFHAVIDNYNFEPLKSEEGNSQYQEKSQETRTLEKHYEYSYDYQEDYNAISENYFYPNYDSNILDIQELERHGYDNDHGSQEHMHILNVPDYADVDYGVVQHVEDEQEHAEDDLYDWNWNDWESKKI